MKKSGILLFSTLIVLMSSCVYSLFPIYTEDTLVFKEELLGKWYINNDRTDYMLFEKKESKTTQTSNNAEYKYVLKVRDGFTMSSNEPIFIIRDGKKIYDEDIIRAEMLKVNFEENKEPEADENRQKRSIKEKDFKGTVSISEDDSYRLTIHQNGKDEKYLAHLVDIGGDLFLDLYPDEVGFGDSFSMNFFPVHTFMKVELRSQELDMTFFDLEKLNKLFESNLIRLRHENVDGTVLITAQPKELQKFIDKYSDDTSVFEATETYQKAS